MTFGRQINADYHRESRISEVWRDRNNFIGAYSASEWFRRNLYIWSLVQKEVALNDDDRIMVLLGASHIATMEKFIDDDNNWKAVELINLIN